MEADQAAAMEISVPLLQNEGIVDADGPEIERIPAWRDQITLRGLVVSAVLGTIFCMIVHKLNLTAGIIPSLNVAAGLLGFFFVKSWTQFTSRCGFSVQPFTRQENTVIQTCVVACYTLAFSGGFGSYLLSMDEKTYKLIGEDCPGNRAEDVKNPGLLWMMGFTFIVSFTGIFSLVPLRKTMILDYKLIYPSGTATAMLINSFHSSTGAELSGNQVSCLGKYLSISFCWSCFKWFFSGVGASCGFDNFPSFGLTLFKNTFYFDFSPTYVGCGLICPHLVSCSILLGATISWGFLWPFISQKAGDWYPADLATNDFKGLYGYKVFIPISLILGDGLYNLIKIILLTMKGIRTKRQNLPIIMEVTGYWWNKRSEMRFSSKTEYLRGLLLLGNNGGVLAGLAACGVMMSILATSAELMQDFRTGYLTLSSSKSMFVSQIVGTAMGCVIAPLTFWLYWSAFDVGTPDSTYKAPDAVLYREMAVLGVEGFRELPKYCLALCCGFFVVALAINLLREVTPQRVSQFIPIPMAMAVPFYIGASFAVDMFIGNVTLFVWEWLNGKDAEDYAGAVASGLICGDGLWAIPSAILSILKIIPPMCMYFGPSTST